MKIKITSQNNFNKLCLLLYNKNIHNCIQSYDKIIIVFNDIIKYNNVIIEIEDNTYYVIRSIEYDITDVNYLRTFKLKQL